MLGEKGKLSSCEFFLGCVGCFGEGEGDLERAAHLRIALSPFIFIQTTLYFKIMRIYD